MPRGNVIVTAFNNGKKEALQEWREKTLTFLEEKYMDKAVKRNTPEGEAILTIARELSEFLRA